MADGREPDPIRGALIERWVAYLDGSLDIQWIRPWLDGAIGSYRDEIVHLGLQLFNDHLVENLSPETLAASRESFNDWLKQCADFDADPYGWGRAYWRRYLIRLRADNPELAAKAARRLRGDPLTKAGIISVFGSESPPSPIAQ